MICMSNDITDYSKYKKAISRYKFRRVIQNKKTEWAITYRTFKKTMEIKNDVCFYLDGFVYVAEQIDSIKLLSETDSYFRYYVGDVNNARADWLAYYTAGLVTPF